MTGLTISKRGLLKGMGALATVSATASMAKAWAADTWDVIVVGGGTAGLPTAIFAASRGLRVLVIEKSGFLGGTLDRSTGQIAAAGTKFQKAKGIKDFPQEHYDDIMRIGKNGADPALTRLFVDNAAAALDWLADQGFAPLPEHPIKEGGHEPYSVARYLWGPDGGRSILKILHPAIEKAVAAGNVTVLLRTGAAELVQDKTGAVTGVVAEDESGRRTLFSGHNVVLTAGGCASNPRMYEELHKVPLYGRVAYPYSQGQGLQIGVAAGGIIHNGDKYLPSFGTILLDNNFPSPIFASSMVNPKVRQPWEIYVNRNGERFIREDNPHVDDREHALVKQPGQAFWAVFDQEIFDRAPSFVPTLNAEALHSAFELHPMFTRANTLEELSKKTGIDGAGLARSVATYNDGVVAKKDALGREHLPLPVTKGPYYAIRHQGWSLLSWAGLKTDNQLRVVRSNGQHIPNLHAAGETLGAGLLSGSAYVNGMMVTPALTFGRLLGLRLSARA